jgi:autotransporter-associated beta strand protein
VQFNVSFDTASSPNLASLTATEQQAVLDTMNAAATLWSHYLTAANVTLNLTIAINNSFFSGNVLAQGGPDAFGATGATFNGKTVYDTDAGIKLRTGTDINGAAADLTVDLTVNSIRNMLAFKTDDSAAVPGNRVDALSVFLHEIGHGLGIIDASESGTFPGVGVYDTFVQNGKFTGTNAEAAAGAPSGIPLEPGSLSHLSESSAYGGDLMSTAIGNGTNVHISAIDLGILQDIGVAVRLPTSGDDDVYALWGNNAVSELHLGAGNDTGHAASGGSYLYGDDGNDTLYGGTGADQLHGGNGDDTLYGGGNNDYLFGDAGTDTAIYSATVNNYQVFQITPNQFQVRDLRSGSPDGVDTLFDVERIQWSDGSITTLIGANVVDNNELTYSSGGTISDNVSGTGHVSFRGSTAYYVTGNFTQTGGTTIYEGAVVVGPNGSTGGNMGSIAGDIVVGVNTANSGINFNHSDQITVSGNISGLGYVVQMGTGLLALTGNNTYAGPTVVSQGTLAINNPSNIGAGDIRLYDQGTLQFTAGPVSLAQNITLSGGSLDTFGNISATLSGILSTAQGVNTQAGYGGFTKLGVGTLTLTGNNTYSGMTVVSAGTLLVDGSIASSSVSVSNQTRLGGSGTVGSTTIWAGGVLAPGDGIGTLTVNGNLTLASGATDAEELSPTTADEIIVNGNASIAGNLTGNFAGGSYGHQTYTILHATGTLSGTFANVTATGLPAGQGGFVTYDAQNVYLTTDYAPVVTTTNVTAVHGQTLAASSLFSVSDTDGDTITRYQLWDGTDDPLSGHFVVNGVAQAARTVIDISAAQLAQVSFVTGGVGDALQIRASDGIAWSPNDSTGHWALFNVSVPVNHAPVLTTSNVAAQNNQTLAASSLFTVSDADGDAITRYQLWDGTDDPSSGHFVVNGVTQAPRTVIDITAAQLAQTSFVTGSVGDALQIRAYDGTAWSSDDSTGHWALFNVSVPGNHAPVVTTANYSARANQTLALSSLFTVSDADGDAITKYQLWDAISDPASGNFVVNEVVQAPRTVVEITAAQLAQTSFVTGTSSDNLQIRAFDGTAWSPDDSTGHWAPFTVVIAPSHAPSVGTSGTVAKLANQTWAASDLFFVSDEYNSPITRYQLFDASNDASSGYFIVNGVAQRPGTVLDLSPADLAQTSFITGTAVGDTLRFRAYNGYAWSAPDLPSSWTSLNLSLSGPLNHRPELTVGTRTSPTGGFVTPLGQLSAQRNQTLAPSSFMLTSDADGDAITEYQLLDTTTDPNSGHWVVGGVAQAAGTVIDLTAAQFAQTVFVTGTVGDVLQMRVSDGKNWSASSTNGSDFLPSDYVWDTLTISTLNVAPVVTTANVTLAHNQTVAASSLFSVSDADGDTITRYQLWDGTTDPSSGYFVVNGVAQAPRTVIDITAAQLAQTSFVTGSVGDALQIRAYDGTAWSPDDSTGHWALFNVSVPINHAPVVTTSDVAAQRNQTLAASSLFTVSDADGDTITRYQLWDGTDDPSSGHFVVGGVAQAPRTVIDITAAQLAQTSFVTGSVGDALQIRAYDGTAWGPVDSTGHWALFNVSLPPNNPPVVTTADITAQASHSLAASSLFTVSDADGDAITQYQLWDGTDDPSSGNFVVNGVTQSPRTVIDIPSSQLGQVSFLTGSTGDMLQVRASDGKSWSPTDSTGHWSPFHVAVG